MRPIKPNTRRRTLWRTVLLVLLVLVFGGAGTVGGLAWLNVIDPAKLAFWRSKDAIPADWVYIPVCAKQIPAYSLVTREYLLDPRKPNQFLVDPLPPRAFSEFVAHGGITKISQLSGRVTSREKDAGYFYESDFLPQGTHPGVTGGTPPGKLAFTLDAAKLKGVVYDLKAGDHVVLQSSTAVDMPGAGHSNGGRLGASMVVTPDMALLPKRSIVTTLVEDGVVVTPARTRNMPVSSSSLTQGMTTRTLPVQEIVIAVDPQEVRLLNEAVDLKYEITCMVRSGRPSSAEPPASRPPSGGASHGGMSAVFASLAKAVLSGGSTAAPDKATPPGQSKAVNGAKSKTPAQDRVAREITPGLDPFAQVRYMEVLIGKDRQFVLFTGPGNTPAVESQDERSAKAGAGAAPAGAVEESR